MNVKPTEKFLLEGIVPKHWAMLFLGLVLAHPGKAQVPSTSYRLVFAEEFNGTSVDTTKWNINSPGWLIDPPSLSTAAASEVNVANGVLALGSTRPTSAAAFNSGAVSTYGLYSYTGGYIEARIQLPTTPGSWPAFWGLYTGWPPEADIMEYPLTTDSGTDGLLNYQYNTAFHYVNSSGADASGAGEVNTGENLGATGFHVFGMNWTPGSSVTFSLDQSQVSSFYDSAVSQMAYMYINLSYGVGGWPGTPSITQWPAGWSDQMQVDWVRVWQINPNGDTTSSWKINGGGAFTTGGNWNNGIVPSYGNQTAVFGPVGSATTAAISMPNWEIFGDITFSGGATAYTLGSSSNLIQLVGQPLGSSPVGSTVVASSSSTASQNINAKVELWSNTTFNNAMTGGEMLNFNGPISGNGSLTVTGPGVTFLNGINSYSGGTSIGLSQEAVVLRAGADNALGTGSVAIGPGGNVTTADLQLTGTCALMTSGIDMRGRANNSAGIENLNGNNILSGTVSADVGGNVYTIQSDSGLLTLNGNLQATSGSRAFTLQGAGNGMVSGQVLNGGGTCSVFKSGAGAWALTGSNTYTGSTTINAGTLELAPACVARYTFNDVSGSTVFNDGNGGAAMNGTLASGATILSGSGPLGGNALSLSSGGYVNINNPIIDMGSAGQWTVSAWIKTTTPGATILSKSGGPSWTYGNTILYLGTGSAGGAGGIPSSVRYAGGFFQASGSATSVDDGNWHMVTYVNSGGTYAIYVDDVAQPLSSGNSDFGYGDVGTVIRLGVTTDNESGDGTVNFSGLMGDVQFYSEALTAAQIATVYQGQIQGGSLPSGASVSIASGATFETNGVNQTIAGALSGGGSLVETGTGTLILAGSNTYTGSTTVSNGTLELAPACVARYTFNNVSGSTVVNDGYGGVTMNGTLTGGATIVSGGRFGGNALSLSGGAYVNINNPIINMGPTSQWAVSAWVKTTTAGATILSKSAGPSWGDGNTVFYLGNGSAGGSGGIPSGVRWGGGFFQGSSSATSVDNGNWHMVTYVNNGGTFAIYVDGVAQPLSSGNSGLLDADVGTDVRLGFTTDNESGDGTVNFSGLMDDVEFYSEALSATQVTALYQGQVPAGSLPSAASISIAGGATLELNGVNQTIAGALSGAGALVQTGTGTLTLTGSNTYSGPTSINSGTFDLLGSLSGATPVTVGSGATLTGAGPIAGALSLSGSAIHAPGAPSGVQSIGGALSYGAGAHLEFTLSSNAKSPANGAAAAGVLTVASGAVIDLNFNTPGSTVSFYNAFWTQAQSWPVVTSNGMTGAFALGTITNDAGGNAASAYGTFSLAQTSGGVTLNWTPAPFTAWRGANYGANATNPAISNFLSEPIADGMPNGVAYYYDLNPNTSNSNPMQVQIANSQATITFPRNTQATDVLAEIQGESSLNDTWTNLAQSTGGAAFTPLVSGITVGESGTGVTRTVSFRDLYLTTDPTHPSRFYRLWIEQQ